MRETVPGTYLIFNTVVQIKGTLTSFTKGKHAFLSFKYSKYHYTLHKDALNAIGAIYADHISSTKHHQNAGHILTNSYYYLTTF